MVRIPLRGKRTERRHGLVIKSSDCENLVPPAVVNDKHAEIQQMIDRRKVQNGVIYGHIEHEDGEVTDWEVSEKLL